MSDKIYFARKHDGIKIPSKRDEDGAYDIYADMKDIQIIEIPPFSSIMIKTGLYSAFDKKYRFVFQERGSTGIKNLKVNAGLIDSGFRGEWIVILYNMNKLPVFIYRDEDNPDVNTARNDVIFYPSSKAICQAKREEVPEDEIIELTLEELLKIESERGSGMLGSSGK